MKIRYASLQMAVCVFILIAGCTPDSSVSPADSKPSPEALTEPIRPQEQVRPEKPDESHMLPLPQAPEKPKGPAEPGRRSTSLAKLYIEFENKSLEELNLMYLGLMTELKTSGRSAKLEDFYWIDREKNLTHLKPAGLKHVIQSLAKEGVIASNTILALGGRNLVDTFTTFFSNPSVLRQHVFYQVLDDQGNPTAHVSQVLLEKHDGKNFAAIIDSLGESGAHTMLTNLIEAKTAALASLNLHFVVLDSLRQYDDESCSDFTINDSIYLANDPQFLQRILEAGASKNWLPKRSVDDEVVRELHSSVQRFDLAMTEATFVCMLQSFTELAKYATCKGTDFDPTGVIAKYTVTDPVTGKRQNKFAAHRHLVNLIYFLRQIREQAI